MKRYLLFVAAFFVFLHPSCKKLEAQSGELSDCLQAKFEAFKQTPSAHSIVKISRPDGPLYWFLDTTADGGESVLDQNCELVCVEDCKCIGNIVFCDDSHLNFPKETIWQK